ncbi:MAG: DUF4239 domain-containing protein [Pseudomonadota bacterium]|nr:DUF4239 domain-containing protein [Pseudomonadota bacterium]
MSYTAAILAFLLSAGLAGAVSYAVHRRLSYDLRRRHHDVGSAIFLQMGVIYAVLLAFVFSEVWGEYNAAAQAINAECGALHASAILAHDLPNDAGDALNLAIAAYVATVVTREWPSMEGRQASVEAVRGVEAMLKAAIILDRPRAPNTIAQAEILNLLAQAHAQRETRIFQMTQGMPALLWALLLFYALVLVSFVLCSGVEHAATLALFSSLFAAGLALILVMIRMLDFPFEGALGLPSATFQETLLKVSVLVRLAHGGI